MGYIVTWGRTGNHLLQGHGGGLRVDPRVALRHVDSEGVRAQPVGAEHLQHEPSLRVHVRMYVYECLWVHMYFHMPVRMYLSMYVYVNLVCIKP